MVDMNKIVSKIQSFFSSFSERKKLQSVFREVAIGNNCQFIGLKNISIGKGSCIGDNSWLNVCIRDDTKRMIIGEAVLIGRQSVISAADYLSIGSYCVLAPRVYISNADHKFESIHLPILCQGFVDNKKIVIEENCWLGINSIVLGAVTIGRGSIIGANTIIRKDVLPFSVVVGETQRIVKMYNPQMQNWEKIENNSDIERILRTREVYPLPSRLELLENLKKSSFSSIEQILSGSNLHI